MSDEENIVDIETLSQVNRQYKAEEDFSPDMNKRILEKNDFVNTINKPFRELEFNILLHICDQSYIPYNNMKYSVEKENNRNIYYVSIPKIDIEPLLPVLEDNNTDISFITIEYLFNRTRAVFRHKEPFRTFSDGAMIDNSKNYKKLFGLSVEPNIKSLYYFLTMFKYDFLSIVQNYENVYKSIRQIDDFFCARGYHKRITKEEDEILK